MTLMSCMDFRSKLKTYSLKFLRISPYYALLSTECAYENSFLVLNFS